MKHTMRQKKLSVCVTAVKICHFHETVFMELQKLNGNAGQKLLSINVMFILLRKLWC